MSWRGLDVFRTEVLPTGTVLRPRLARRARGRSRTKSAISSRRLCFTSSGAYDASTAARARSAIPCSSRPSRSAAISYSRFSVVLNIGGSSELIVTTTPASTNCRERVLLQRRDRAGGDVGRRAHLERDPVLGEVGEQGGVGGAPTYRARSARRPASGARPRPSRARSSPPRAARSAGRRRVAAAKCGSNCGRDTPTSGPPSPKATSPSGAWSSA